MFGKLRPLDCQSLQLTPPKPKKGNLASIIVYAVPKISKAGLRVGQDYGIFSAV